MPSRQDVVEISRKQYKQNKKEIQKLQSISNKLKNVISSQHRQQSNERLGTLQAENEILHELGNRRVPHQILDNYFGDLGRRHEMLARRRTQLDAQASALNDASIATMDAFQQGALGYQEYGTQIHGHQLEVDRIYMNRQAVREQEIQDDVETSSHLHKALQMNRELDKKRILPREIKEHILSYF